jgi:hypothetical protein
MVSSFANSQTTNLLTPDEHQHDGDIDRMSFQMPKELGVRLREVVNRRNIGISTFIRECVEEGISRESPEEKDDAGRRRIAICVSGELAEALAETARLYHSDPEHIVLRVLRENIGQLLTRGRAQRDELRAAIKGLTPPRQDSEA